MNESKKKKIYSINRKKYKLSTFYIGFKNAYYSIILKINTQSLRFQQIEHMLFKAK